MGSDPSSDQGDASRALRRGRGRSRLRETLPVPDAGGQQTFTEWTEEHGQPGWRGLLGVAVVYLGILFVPELWGATIQIRYGRLVAVPLLAFWVGLTYAKYRKSRPPSE